MHRFAANDPAVADKISAIMLPVPRASSPIFSLLTSHARMADANIETIMQHIYSATELKTSSQASLFGTEELHTKVNDAYRHQGIGRSVLLHLSTICKAKGRKPIANCPSSSISTFRTLYSAGFIAPSSIIKVFF